jgi:hypothetical protein
MEIRRVMMRPRPKRRKVEEVAEVAQVAEEYKRCSGCVSRKMCDKQEKCLHGTSVKPKGKKNGTNR